MAQFFLFIPLLWVTTTAAATYGLQDLEVLVQENSYGEFFEHALDVRPSLRQEAWKSMVSKMGDGLTTGLLRKETLEKADFEQVERLFKWPQLRNDDVFKARRNSIGLKYLGRCLKSESPCLQEMKTFWEQDKSDPDVAIKLAELSRNLSNSPVPTWTFLDVALKSPLSEFYCKDEFVMASLWGKIEIDYIRLTPKGDLMKKIDETIHPDCMPHLLKEANLRLLSPPKVMDRELAFQIIKSQMKATESLTDFFYTVYLLDGPSQGELFNYAWNRVKELGGTVNRREAVLKQLKALDPLPDSLLGALDETKKRVILGHFKTYFPEYIDHYTDKCVKYYGGKEEFPRGNPTIHCQDLMNSELAPKIIDDYKIKQYQEARKI